MKRMKKVFAMLLAFAMVMGMSLTTFAAPDDDPLTGNITVKGLNANEETTVKIYQVVSHSANNSSWNVANWATGEVDLTKDPVEIDWKDLKDSVESTTPAGILTLTKVAGENVTEVTFENLPIGAYLIVASGNLSTYNAMGTALYTYDESSHLITAPAEDKVVWAKYTNYVVEKEISEDSCRKCRVLGVWRGELRNGNGWS